MGIEKWADDKGITHERLVFKTREEADKWSWEATMASLAYMDLQEKRLRKAEKRIRQLERPGKES